MIFMTSPRKPQPSQAAFALLITIVVISVVLAIGISLLNITVKQISLSITGRDSEVAFHAAQAGIECVQQMLNSYDYISVPPPPSIACITSNSVTLATEPPPQPNVEQRSFEIDWNNGDVDVCTQADLYLIDATAGAVMVNFTNQGLPSYNCANGDFCVAAFSRGYNRPCNQLNSLRTVQREITITL